MCMVNGGHLSIALKYFLCIAFASFLNRSPQSSHSLRNGMYPICVFFSPVVTLLSVSFAVLFFLPFISLPLTPLLSVVFRFYTPIDNIHFGKKRERFNIDLINTTHFELISFAFSFIQLPSHFFFFSLLIRSTLPLFAICLLLGCFCIWWIVVPA